MSLGSHSYDHQLKIGSTTKGLRLVRDDGGRAMYQVLEDVPTYESQIKFAMTSWMGGHGQYAFGKDDIYFEGQSIDTTQDGVVFLGPLINQVGISGASLGANPVCFCWFAAISKLMVATATKVFWYDGTNFVEKTEIAGETITDMIEFNGILYVALGGSTRYYYSSNGVNYTQTDLTHGYAQKFLNSPNPAGTSNMLWAFKQPNEVRSTTDGRTVADDGVQWSTPPNYIGDTSNNITNLFLVNDNLMVGREDNLFHYDSDGGVHPLMGDLKHNRSSNNFKYITDWQTGVYFSLGNGLGEITSYDSFEPMGPLTDIDDINKTGSCVGLSSDKDFIYAAMDEGTNTHIYKGREIRRAGGLRWEWCPWIFLSTNACAAIKVVQHSSTDRRLWFGYGNYCGYVKITDNPLADSNAQFAASGWIRMSYYYGTNAYWDKLFQSIVTETAGCSNSLPVIVKYRADTDTTTESLALPITTNGVVKTDFHDDLSCKRIQFELSFATNDSTTTPEVLYFEARGIEKPETIRIHEATYTMGDTPSRKGKTIRDFLRDGRTSTSLIRFADLRYGQTTADAPNYIWVVLMPGSPSEIEILHEKGKSPELGLHCRWQEVNFAVD